MAIKDWGFKQGERVAGTRLIFLEHVSKTPKTGRSRSKFLCDCGSVVVKENYTVCSKNTMSCGCLRREVTKKMASTHGKSGSKEHRAWKNMVERCKKTNKSHKYYFDQGIKVCDEWLGDEGFRKFLNDMGDCPDGHELDRINTTLGYSPENCRWADKNMQSFNKRKYIKNNLRTGVQLMYTGVDGTKLYYSYIRHNGESVVVCRTHDYEEAVQARIEAELKYYGQVLPEEYMFDSNVDQEDQ